MNYFSTNIAHLRKERGFVQQDMTDQLGVKRNTWSNWENGISQPGIDELIKIAQFFDIGLTELLTKDLANTAEGSKEKKPDKKGNQDGMVHEDIAAYNSGGNKNLSQKMQALEAEMQDMKQAHTAIVADLRKIITHLKLK